MIDSTTLYSVCNNISASLFSLIFGFSFGFFYHQNRFMFNVVFNHCKKIIFCFFRSKSGYSFQLLKLLFMELFNFFFLFFKVFHFSVHLLFTLFIGISLAVKSFFLLNKTSLRSGKLVSSVSCFFFKLILCSDTLLFCFQENFLLLRFCFFLCVFNYIIRSFFGNAYFCFGNLLSIAETNNSTKN